ncbi:macrophage mannose receptor 1-like protein, partial [Leptotrombidium deliense]
TFKRATLWLGGQRVKGTNKWEWTDGRPVKYTRWNRGEPNNANNNENCIQFYSNGGGYSGKWNDYPCHVSEHGVCEIWLKDTRLNEKDMKLTEVDAKMN